MTFEYSSGVRSIADELLYRERQLRSDPKGLLPMGCQASNPGVHVAWWTAPVAELSAALDLKLARMTGLVTTRKFFAVQRLRQLLGVELTRVRSCRTGGD